MVLFYFINFISCQSALFFTGKSPIFFLFFKKEINHGNQIGNHTHKSFYCNFSFIVQMCVFFVHLPIHCPPISQSSVPFAAVSSFPTVRPPILSEIQVTNINNFCLHYEINYLHFMQMVHDSQLSLRRVPNTFSAKKKKQVVAFTLALGECMHVLCHVWATMCYVCDCCK